MDIPIVFPSKKPRRHIILGPTIEQGFQALHLTVPLLILLGLKGVHDKYAKIMTNVFPTVHISYPIPFFIGIDVVGLRPFSF